MRTLATLDTGTGGDPRDALVQGTDKRRYGTNSLCGGSDSNRVDGGTVFQINPPLAK